MTSDDTGESASVKELTRIHAKCAGSPRVAHEPAAHGGASLNQSLLREEHINMYMNKLMMSRYSSMAAMMKSSTPILLMIWLVS